MTRRMLLAIGLMTAAVTGCTSGIAFDSAQAPVPGIVMPAEEAAAEVGNDMTHPKGKVTVWSYYSGAEWIVPIVKAKYPELEIELKFHPWVNYIEDYLSAIDNGNAPDVLFADNNMLSQLVGMKISEDLTAEPYNGKEIAALFNESTIAPYRALTDSHLFALPLDIGPGVAYYRRDLFEKAGLPTEPVALSRYLEHPDNWLKAAEKLKRQGSWIFASELDPLSMAAYGSGFFDRELNYLRDSSTFATALDLARQIRKSGLASGLNLNSAAGQEALKDGKTAMIFNGWWYRDALKASVPDMAGLWGIMRLPLQVYGWSGSSGTLISASSGNKAGAWAVVSTLAHNIRESYANSEKMLLGTWPDSGDVFFAGQRTQALYADLVRQMPPFIPTPMDGKADNIWNQMIASALANDVDANEILDNIKQLTMDSIQSDIDTLKAQRQRQ